MYIGANGYVLHINHTTHVSVYTTIGTNTARGQGSTSYIVIPRDTSLYRSHVSL